MASKNEIIKLLRRVEHESNKVKLKVNRNKIKMVVVDRFNTLQKTDRLNEYELVHIFNYPGLTITNYGNCNAEVRLKRLTKL